jgi:succinoglycan biosynthesis protein ExoO
MLISIVVPAFRAQATLARAVKSALTQTWQDTEIIVVADDGADYQLLLREGNIRDERLRFTTTGRVASGCHNARNVGLTLARGDFIAHLDADDVILPERLATLVPIAQAHGAATDNPRIVDDATGVELYRAFEQNAPARLDIIALLALTVPLFPLVAREYAAPRLEGIELGEDFVANLRLIERIGSLAVCADSLLEYRVVRGSLSHNEGSAAGFEKNYTALIGRLDNGDRLGLSPTNVQLARDGLVRKREINREFAAAQQHDAALTFQQFAAQRR